MPGLEELVLNIIVRRFIVFVLPGLAKLCRVVCFSCCIFFEVVLICVHCFRSARPGKAVERTEGVVAKGGSWLN